MGHWLASLSIKELGPQYVNDFLLPIHIVVSLDIIILFEHLHRNNRYHSPQIQQIHSKDLHVLRLTSIPSPHRYPFPKQTYNSTS